MGKSNYYMKVDMLGNIWIKDMIIFYDEPLVFTCFNDFGNYFIANCSDINDASKEWLFLPISEARLIKGLKGNISAYNLFKFPEGNFLWKVTQNFDNELAMARQIFPQNISDENLPDKDVYYNIIEESFLPKYDEKIVEDSYLERRDIFDISLELNDSHEHELPAEFIGKSIYDIQRIIYYIGDKKIGANSNINNDTINKYQLNFVGTKASSLRLRFKSKDLANILNQSFVQDSINILMDLFDCKNNEDGLKKIFSKISMKASLKYKQFLENLDSNNVGIRAYLATPKKTYKKANMTTQDIKNSLKIIDTAIENNTNIITYIGDLTGYDYNKNNFIFTPKEKGAKSIKGKVSDSLDKKCFTIPTKNITVEIEETVKLNYYTKNAEKSFKLIKILNK